MADVDGRWNVIVKTPIGDQNGVLSIASAGDSFTGTLDGDLGAKSIAGWVDNDVISWDMDISSPMPLSLSCTARVEGDSLTGSVTTGAFGAFGLSGTRTG